MNKQKYIRNSGGGRVCLDETQKIFQNFLELDDLKREEYIQKNYAFFNSALKYWRMFHSTQQDVFWGEGVTKGLRKYLKNEKDNKNKL